jgi:hypothetical protein
VRAAFAAVALAGALGLGAGCAEKQVAVDLPNDATHVSGTVARIDDQRPVDGGVTITVTTASGAEEAVYVASMFTAEPPTSVVLALQAKVSELAVGDRITATGARDGEGRFVVQVLEIHAP